MAKLKVGTTIGGRDVMDEMDDHVNEHIRHTNYAAATGSANNYAVTLSPAPSAYVEGMCVVVKININNTGASTINVNGLGAKSIKKSNGNDVSSGNLKAGSIYTVRYNGTNFILQGEGGEYGTAQPEHVLEDYTFGTEEGVKQGEMTNNGPASAQTVNLTSQNQEYTISQGYHTGLRKIKAAISGLVASVIKAGTTVGGILGTFTSDATATAERILSGYSAYVNGSKVNGSMPNRGTINYTPGTSDQTVANGYHSGAGKVYSLGGDAAAANVLTGKTFSSNVAGRAKSGTMPNNGSNNIQAQFDSDVSIPEGYYNGSGKVLKPVVDYGDNIIVKADENIKSRDSTSYGKVKEIEILYPGTYKVYFWLKSSIDTKPVYGRIYKNGSAYGDEVSVSSASYVGVSNRLSFAAGDKCQLYIKSSESGVYAFTEGLDVRSNVPRLARVTLD